MANPSVCVEDRHMRYGVIVGEVECERQFVDPGPFIDAPDEGFAVLVAALRA